VTAFAVTSTHATNHGIKVTIPSVREAELSCFSSMGIHHELKL
jgi:hypothetical protein